jgi:hypothetical protein
MNFNRLGAFITAVLIASGTSNAMAEDPRTLLVQRIAVAQGLNELFDQQMIQQREATKGFAAKVFEQAVAQSGGQANQKERAAFEKMTERAAEMFSGKEIVSAWVESYGKDLALQDLQAILTYYESPVGRKDVAATKAAMPAFTAWLSGEAQARATTLVNEFMAELQAARK